MSMNESDEKAYPIVMIEGQVPLENFGGEWASVPFF